MPTELDDIRALAANEDARAALRTALRELARAKAKTEDLVAAVYRAVGDAIIAHEVAPLPKRDNRKHPGEVALWVLSDWQGGKRTTSYDSQVMRRRVHQYIDKAESITAIQRADHPVRSVAILFGGDMLEGLFQFPTQPFEVDASIFGQWVAVTDLIVETIERALAIYDRVDIFDEWGNHGRIGSKRDAVPRSDNLDRMCYQAARMRLAAEKRVTFHGTDEDIQQVEIGNYRAILLHGDETGRNGFVSATTFLTYLNKLKAGAFGWDFQDAYTGHRHTHDEYAMADGHGAWYQTGSTESDNRYARNGLGSAAQPSQRLHFVDPTKGRITAQYKIWLD
jgi:hypothetical protein